MNFSKYVNIPYKYKGRDFNGCDCWGLVKLIFKKEKGITLPDFWYTDFWEEENFIKNNIRNVNIIKVDYPFKIFDVLLFYNKKRNIVSHMGLIIEDDKFIHTYLKNASRVDRLDKYWISRLYQGVRYSG